MRNIGRSPPGSTLPSRDTSTSPGGPARTSPRRSPRFSPTAFTTDVLKPLSPGASGHMATQGTNLPGPSAPNIRKGVSKKEFQLARKQNRSAKQNAARDITKATIEVQKTRQHEQTQRLAAEEATAEAAAWAVRLQSGPLKNPENALIPRRKLEQYAFQKGTEHSQQFESMGFKLFDPENSTAEEKAEIARQVEDVEVQVRAQLARAPCYTKPLVKGNSAADTAEKRKVAEEKVLKWGPIVNTPMLIRGPKEARYCVVGWILRHGTDFGSLTTIYPDNKITEAMRRQR